MGSKEILAPLQYMVPTLSEACTCIILLLVFGSCILNLLVKFVSFHLESIKLQISLMDMPLMEMKTQFS
jgi:hypothetical protein